MVAPLKKAPNNSTPGIKPAQFYGNSLPRPRFYSNPNSHRVDPPVSVLDPLLSWANDAHWSMGGLNSTRLRHQGRIEGKISKLCSQREEFSPGGESSSRISSPKFVTGSGSPPPAPMVTKRRRRFLDLNDENDESGSEGECGSVRTRRKLIDEFDSVAIVNEIDNGRKFTVDDEAMDKVEELLGLNCLNWDVKKGNGTGKGMKKSSAKSSDKKGRRNSPRLAKLKLN